MKALVNLLLVVGFCGATVGAAGFHDPAESASDAPPGVGGAEPLAWPLFLGGMALVAAGGVLERTRRRAAKAGGAATTGTRARLVEELGVIRSKIVALDEGHEKLSDDELKDAIASLLSNEYFDLTSRNDEFSAELGFSDYAKVWEGVATAERLLARCWSMATDDFREEGVLELPAARAWIERACAAAESL